MWAASPPGASDNSNMFDINRHGLIGVTLSGMGSQVAANARREVCNGAPPRSPSDNGLR
jgi:hypothetical protein